MIDPMNSKPSIVDGLETADEVGKPLGVTGRTILNWAAAGIIPTALRVGRVVRFDFEEVRKALGEATKKNLESKPSAP
jgi:excisionase family DNA binding protein